MTARAYLDAVRKRCDEATPEPWIPFTPSGVPIPSIRRSREACEPSQWYVIAKFGNVDATDELRQEQTNNRDFCLHARTDLPKLERIARLALDYRDARLGMQHDVAERCALFAALDSLA